MRDKDRGLGQNTDSQEKGHQISVGCNHKQQAGPESGNMIDTY